MKQLKRHIHDWQWSEEQSCYLCHCGESMLSEDTPRVEPVETRTLYKMHIRVDSANVRAYFSVNNSAEQPLVIPGTTSTMNEADLAARIAGYFKAVGYPYPGTPQIRPSPPERYPLVVAWDDRAEVTRIVACCASESELKDALNYAETMAAVMEVTGEAPCGTACHAAWPGGFIHSEE